MPSVLGIFLYNLFLSTLSKTCWIDSLIVLFFSCFLLLMFLFYFLENLNVSPTHMGYPGGSAGKESACNAGDQPINEMSLSNHNFSF